MHVPFLSMNIQKGYFVIKLSLSLKGWLAPSPLKVVNACVLLREGGLEAFHGGIVDGKLIFKDGLIKMSHVV